MHEQGNTGGRRAQPAERRCGRLKPNAVQVRNPGTARSSTSVVIFMVVAGFPACLPATKGRLESLLPPRNCP